MAAPEPDWRARVRTRGSRAAVWAASLHARWGRTFWTVHSIWALLTGVAVLVLAHNRYGFVPWVVMFLALTWASTLFFSRFSARLRAWRGAQLAQGFVSYLTRIMYQETLFFMLPFYFYSTTFPSWNSAFVVGLAVLAVLSCLDLAFDRWLRGSRPFALGFFAVVSFSALQFFMPMVLGARLHHGIYLAAVASFVAALPLAYSNRELLEPRRLLRFGVALLAVVVGATVLRPALPPVPLRLAKVRFAAALDPVTLQPARELGDAIPVGELGARLYAIATVVSPNRLPTTVRLRFSRNGHVLHLSRTVEMLAHPRGFRVWDALPAPSGGFSPGLYTIEVWTAEGQLIGRRRVHLIR